MAKNSYIPIIFCAWVSGHPTKPKDREQPKDNRNFIDIFQGVIERDEIVFESVRKRNIPIVMVTSGGYQRSNARIIADSILNLHQKGLINCQEALSAPPPGEQSHT